jgi:cell wall assembly regulator SMI1
VEALERELGIQLPEDYKKIAMAHQGMAPVPEVVDVGSGNTVVCELLTITNDPEFSAYSMARVYGHLKSYLPAGIYPFASTGAGDFICFDYRNSAVAPKVVFYFTEEAGQSAFHPIADSFTEFLARLHD